MDRQLTAARLQARREGYETGWYMFKLENWFGSDRWRVVVARYAFGIAFATDPIQVLQSLTGCVLFDSRRGYIWTTS